MSILLIILLAVVLGQGSLSKTSKESLAHTQLLKKIEAKEVKSVVIQSPASGDVADAKVVLSSDVVGAPEKVAIIYASEFMAYLNGLPKDIRDAVEVSVIQPPQPSLLMTMLPTLMIVGLLIFVLMFFMQQMQGGGGGGKVMSFGKSKAKMMTDDQKKTTFKNVAGLDEEKQELSELVDFLKSPKKYIDVGARIPKGVLLVGPPGTGKTLLARAVSGEAGVPFFSISGSDFVEMFVGVGASRVRDLFEQAKKNAPCIIFIDEIDAVGRKRGAGVGGGHDEREQTLNQLLVEMDGFGDNEGVIMIAATNRADILDPALLRPGRFDRQVVVGRPDVKGREDILKIHSRGKPLQEDVNLRIVAQTTPGFTGADLENLMNESALLTARENKRAIDMEEVQKALIKITVGTEKKSHVVSAKERRVTAYHEAGHGIIHEVLSEIDPVHSISIIPTGRAGGYTMSLPGEDTMYVTKTYMHQEIVALLGGRAAEEIVIGDITTGASNDIERATNIARSMVTKYGMSDLGPMKYGEEQEDVFLGRDYNQNRNYSEEVALAIDQQVKLFIEEAYSEAKRLLEENIDALERTAQTLMKKEKVTGDQLRRIMNGEEIDDDETFNDNIFRAAELMREKREEQEKGVDITPGS
ncbi:MAG TPA: ATP-dependent zinc metalloprotease FtsH [Epulopiscium sp.]|nr:ATP-dependent zinc metalloprotease FtsH [Candidatus Epulonipiscium sp.]